MPEARAFWSGTVTFGLVSIPVALFPANRSGRVALRMLAPDGTPLARRWLCPREDRPVDDDEIVRGYQVGRRWVVVTDAELEGLAPEKSRDIDLRQFVSTTAVDPMYFERAYYLAPAGSSTKAYTLLARIMEDSDRAGIATFVMREREYLVAILAERGILRAETLRFHDEIRSSAEAGVKIPDRATPRSVAAFVKAIRKHAKPALDEKTLVDHYADRVEALAKKKYRRHQDVVTSKDSKEPEPAIDLLEALRSTLRSGSRHKAPSHRGATRRRTRTRTRHQPKKRRGAA
ncbi:MAG TPA: Ku protein [Candidatus Binatia bacterium]|nr:Ku protein [Candidatus Binatia bacterium]